MKRIILITAAVAFTATFFIPCVGYAQNGKTISAAANVSDAREYVNVQVDRADRCYETGETMVISVTSSVAGYLTLIDTAVDGSRRIIVPNQWYKEAWIDKGVKRVYPDQNMPFHYNIDPPYGDETIEAIISSVPLSLPALQSVTELTPKEYEVIVEGVASGKTVTAQGSYKALAANSIVVKTFPKGGRPAHNAIETKPGAPKPPTTTQSTSSSQTSSASQPSSQQTPPTTTYVTNGQRTRTEENHGWSFTFGIRLGRFGFNVGVSKYDHSKSDISDDNPMEACAKDAEIYTSLEKDCFGVPDERNVTITGDSATKANILRQLQALCERIVQQTESGAVLFLTWSGHGATHNGVNYLIPRDARPNDPETWISEDELSAVLRTIDQKNCYIVIFLDACHSGGFGRSIGLTKDFDEEEEEETPFYFFANQIQARSASGLFEKSFGDLQSCGIYMLCSSLASEKSYVRWDRESSVFTRALSNAIRTSYPGVTQVDLLPAISTEISNYVETEIAPRRPNAKITQKPWAIDNLGGYLLLRDLNEFPR